MTLIVHCSPHPLNTYSIQSRQQTNYTTAMDGQHPSSNAHSQPSNGHSQHSNGPSQPNTHHQPTSERPPPLPVTWAAEAVRHETAVLPVEVAQCLRKNQYVRTPSMVYLWSIIIHLLTPPQLHLATVSAEARPELSLMNYTFVPTSPFARTPTTPIIAMAIAPGSRKHLNLGANPSVSLLVHDWAAPRSPVVSFDGTRGLSMADYLAYFTTVLSAPSRISAALQGMARLVVPGSEEDAFYRRNHVQNMQLATVTPVSIPDEAVIVVVEIEGVRVSDSLGLVTEYVIVPESARAAG